MSYIRVAANVSDPYTQITDIYAVAFKTVDPLYGPFGNVDTLDSNGIKMFITDNATAPNTAIKRMFENSNGYPDRVNVNQPRHVIAYMDKVYNDELGVVSPVESEIGQAYYVYIYVKNSSGYVFLKPSEVAVTP